MIQLQKNDSMPFAALVGQVVGFSYNGKNRIGTVDKVHPEAVCIKLASGGFKSFAFSKIRSTILPMLDADYENRMNIYDNGR